MRFGQFAGFNKSHPTNQKKEKGKTNIKYSIQTIICVFSHRAIQMPPEYRASRRGFFLKKHAMQGTLISLFAGNLKNENFRLPA